MAIFFFFTEENLVLNLNLENLNAVFQGGVVRLWVRNVIGVRHRNYVCAVTGPAHFPLAPFSRAATGRKKMAALLESLFLKKTDINTVLDWLKNAEVGGNVIFLARAKSTRADCLI